MARTRGQQFSLAMGAESVFGTAPSAPWRRMFCLTFDLGSAQTLNPDAVISAGLSAIRTNRRPSLPSVSNGIELDGPAETCDDVGGLG